MIIKKEYYIVECECGNQLSLVPDCSFTIFDTIEQAKAAITEEKDNGWNIDKDGKVFCGLCPESAQYDYDNE